MVRQAGHSPQPRRLTSSWSQFSAAAKALAALERPEPGGPVNSQACVSPSPSAAWRSWATTAGWPCRSSQTVMRSACRADASSDSTRSRISAASSSTGSRAVQHQVVPGPGRGQVQEGLPGSVAWNSSASDSSRSSAASPAVRRLRPSARVDVEQYRQVRLQPGGGPFIELRTASVPRPGRRPGRRPRSQCSGPSARPRRAPAPGRMTWLAWAAREAAKIRASVWASMWPWPWSSTRERSFSPIGRAARFPGPQHRQAA